ncbi:hypothetical protein HMPREF1550_01692 [Actinomyces sp. oral taxon 877 str. F0543]|nr:hypothetical protein HMPREF1550_01692 [Actinomyces sp. oral taxon 877 str. F0543]
MRRSTARVPDRAHSHTRKDRRPLRAPLPLNPAEQLAREGKVWE